MNRIIRDFMQISVKRRIGIFMLIIFICSSVTTYKNIYTSQKNPCMILNVFQKIPVTEKAFIRIEEYRKLSRMFITVLIKNVDDNYRDSFDDFLLVNDFISNDGVTYYKENIEIIVHENNQELFIVIRKRF